MADLHLAGFLRTLTIKDKDNVLCRLDLSRTHTDEHGCDEDFGWAQREFAAEVEQQYNAAKPIRIIVLKARQLGLSTLAEAILFLWNFIHPGSQQLVIAHQTKSTRALFEKTKLYWRTWPFAGSYGLLSDTQHRYAWSNLSSMEVATAATVETGRGMTLNGVHCSEVGFFDNPDELMIGLKAAVPRRPRSIIILESTANGVGDYFHKTWVDAEAGTSEFSPLFFPWWRHYEYTARHIGIRAEIDGTLDPDEKFLRDTLGLDENRLAWRRFVIDNDFNGDPEPFKAEYPATPSEAFLHTGLNVFPEHRLKECYAPMTGRRGYLERNGDRVELIEDRTGPWTIFLPPSENREWGRYFVAADPTHSTGRDRACIQVINRRSCEQVAVYHGYDEPLTLGQEVLKAAVLYNDATVSSEAEGPGYAVIATLLNSDYPHVWRWRRFDHIPNARGLSGLAGWSSNWKSKELAISFFKHMVLKGEVGPLGRKLGDDGRWHAGIHDQVTFEQLCDFSTRTDWSYGNGDPAGYDDAVDALCIAHICSNSEGPMEYFDPNVSRMGPHLEPEVAYPIEGR